MEKWKTISDYPNYQVSDRGRVKNVNTGKILKPRMHKNGYLSVALYAGSRASQKRFSVHRLVLEAFEKNNNPNEETNHKNGIKTDNRFKNLEWVTKSENQYHSRRVLGKMRGEKHPSVKLTEDEVLFIAAYGHMYKRKDLAKELEISPTTVRKILTGRTWSFITQIG